MLGDVVAWSTAPGVAALLAIAGIVAAVLIPDRSSSPPPGARSGGQFTATSPWRLKIDGTQVGSDPRCTVTVTNTETGEEKAFVNVYGARQFQVQDTGTFRWDRSHPGCHVTRHPGPGTAVLPFSQKSDLGDTDAFTAPEAGGKVAVQVLDFHSYRQCEFVLRDAADGRVLDLGTATPGGGPLRLNPSGRTRVYLADFAGCDVRISAERS